MSTDAGFDHDEVRAFFAALHDGTLPPEDHTRLEQILARSPEARRLWFLHCDIETSLADWAATQHARASQPPAIVQFPASRRSVWIWAAPLAAAAAVMLLAAAWWLRRPDERVPNGVAVLSRAVGVEWAEAAETRAAGAVLAPCALRLKAGAALVEFYSGARVVVEGPADFDLVSAAEGFLRSGRITAHVPPQARGFAVGAPGVRLVDHGTEFGFAVRGNDPPEVHVFEGRVEVARTGAAARSLGGGEAARLDSGTWHGITANRAAFLTEAELTQRDAAEARARFAAWREASGALGNDPATVLHYTFQDDPPAGRVLVNHAQVAGAADETHGSVVGAAWVDGRWPGKRALEFRREGDRVRLTVSQPLDRVTLLAWVRIESLPYALNSLLCADAEQTGALRWELTPKGQLRLGLGRDLGRTRMDWEAVNSEPFLTRERFGQWVLLATTFDGATVHHYANGRLVGQGASFHPPALRIGTADLANWHGQGLRHLTGSMDEFAILARALSGEEVRAIYETGKP